MDESKKVLRTGILILVVLAIVFVVYYFFIYKKAKEQIPADELAKSRTLSPQETLSKGEIDVSGVAADLDKSDDVVRPLVSKLSSHPTFVLWLGSKDLIRKFTAAIDNIANGQSPRPQIDFFNTQGKFKVIAKRGQTYLDPASYERYNIIADIFNSLSVTECAKLYPQLRPLFQQAYRELGYPKEDFHQILLRAIVEVLRTPVVEDKILLEKKVTTYIITEPGLEALSPAQKHILRMGPENIQLIQARLRELALALGFAESQLPKQRVYSPGMRQF